MLLLWDDKKINIIIMSLPSLMLKIQQGIQSRRTSAHSLIILPIESICYRIEKITKSAEVTANDLSLKLAELLLPLSNSERQQLLSENLKQIISDIDSDIIYLNRIELLFEVSLNSNPLNLLKNAARVKPLVIFWPGLYQNGYLTYAEPGHPEYQSYSKEDLKDVLVIVTDT